jgi:6-pyruvoyltetrahydropterin/6-carboxytetrahydropterin synthase
MTNIISKEFHFSAAHRLSGLHKDHPCSRLHGHNYIVEVLLVGQLNSVGFVQDYGELDKIKYYIDTELDHRYLGYGPLVDPLGEGPQGETIDPVLDFNPTAELLARHIYQMCKEDYPLLSSVHVSETVKTDAIYSGRE